jgi:hypothetical protein
MAFASRVLPLNYTSTREQNDKGIPKAAIQSITMAIRIGDNQYAIGYIQEFGWDAPRDVKAIHQMEPYPNGTFGENSDLGAINFFDSTYWPGEPIEVIPGKINEITLTLKRYALYTSNLLAACMRLTGSGTEDNAAPARNVDVNNVVDPNKYVTLIQQVRPFDIYQMYINPIDGKVVFGRKFEEAWFSKIGETIPNAETNEAILEEGEMKAARIRPYFNNTI